jgi:endoglycosylceramidase
LSTDGRWITDARGRVVLLHGVNMVNKLPPYFPAARGFSTDDARYLASEGFNTVRLGIIYKGLEPTRGSYDRAYLERIARTQRVLKRAGIFALIDFHQDMYNERFNGEGWPDWAVQDDGLPAEPDEGFPGNYLVMPALNRAWDHWWAGDGGFQDSYAAAWREVAARFRKEPNVLGYDMLNEPWPGSRYASCTGPDGCPGFDTATLTAFHAKVLAAIRKADPRSTVWYEPLLTFDFGADTAHGDLGGGTGFTWHNYCLGSLPGTPGGDAPPDARQEGCQTEEDMVFDNADAHSKRTGDASLLSEFGATDALDNVQRIVDSADDHLVSWQYWSWFNEDPCCKRPAEGVIRDLSKPPTKDNLKQDKLDVLVRPYPQVVAGTPTKLHFDTDSKQLTFEYALDRPRARRLATEVFVPRRHYPKGYSVKVAGARVLSRPGARLLRLAAVRGAKKVTLTLRPSG